MSESEILYPNKKHLQSLIGRVQDSDNNASFFFETAELLQMDETLERQLAETRPQVTSALINAAIKGQWKVTVFCEQYVPIWEDSSATRNWAATNLAIQLKKELVAEEYCVSITMTDDYVSLEVDLQ